MKPDIHPQYKEVKVTCSCGSVFTTRSTIAKDSLLLEVCSKCHPFYTGTQKIMDTAGRVDRFRQKYGMKGKTAGVAESVKAEPAKTEAAPIKAEVKQAAKEPAKEPVKAEAKKTEAKKKPVAKKTDGKKE